ncbi:DNA-3-methyladenine glycosylase I [Streptomyces colonosanans]|uniref:DNA-3-methyladenine glycosylase I n=1 Tax=Streptomyces colonosanans TaxID=1428652 RepID=UPI000A9CDDCD|nr:DNA-3-methyladenine glycosylase I [Streptomyces colonosanans]
MASDTAPALEHPVDPGVVVGDDGLARPAWASTDPMLRQYYDTEWGMPICDERGLYERISLEAFQAGLSWATILRKRPAFRAAFDDFDPDRVVGYGDADVERLMADAGIVRNRAKILAAVANAQATIRLRDRGGLAEFVWRFKPLDTPRPRTFAEIPTISPESRALSKALRAEGFAFVGPTTMPSWKPSASSTPTCWTPTAAAPPESGRHDPDRPAHRPGRAVRPRRRPGHPHCPPHRRTARDRPRTRRAATLDRRRRPPVAATLRVHAAGVTVGTPGGSRALDQVVRERVRGWFDLDGDIAAIDTVFAADPVLGPLVAERPGGGSPGSTARTKPRCSPSSGSRCPWPTPG